VILFTVSTGHFLLIKSGAGSEGGNIQTHQHASSWQVLSLRKRNDPNLTRRPKISGKVEEGSADQGTSVIKKDEKIETLRRDLLMLKENLRTNQDHLNRVQCAAQRLARAVQLLAKPQKARQQT
jgi:hypothetical protein